MKKLLMVTALMLALVACLSGCYRHEPMYDQGAADRICETGAGMMQRWLDENMPDATLEECAAYIAWTPYDGNEYLTEYATGQISREGKKKTFTIHTVTGEVYFQMDAHTKETLDGLVETYFDEALEAMGIVPESIAEGYAFGCYVMAPATGVPEVSSFDFGLPAGVDDLEAFVMEPQSRLPIYVDKPDITVSEETDLSGYDLAAMEKLEAEFGLQIGSLAVSNDFQFFGKTISRGQSKAKLWEYGCWYEGDGFELRGRVHNREEVRDIETGELTVSDEQVNPETDLSFEETEYGYRLILNNRDMAESLRLKAYEGADILNYDFYCLDEKEYSPGKELSETVRESVWLRLEDGSYLLADSSDESVLWFYNGDVLVRRQ